MRLIHIPAVKGLHHFYRQAVALREICRYQKPNELIYSSVSRISMSLWPISDLYYSCQKGSPFLPSNDQSSPTERHVRMVTKFTLQRPWLDTNRDLGLGYRPSRSAHANQRAYYHTDWRMCGPGWTHNGFITMQFKNRLSATYGSVFLKCVDSGLIFVAIWSETADRIFTFDFTVN